MNTDIPHSALRTPRSDDPLLALAERAGLIVHWHNWRGEPREVARDTLRAVLAAMDLPCATPAQIADSFARLEAEAEATPSPLMGEGRGGGGIARAPQRGFGIDDMAPGQRLWGLAAQLYALRRDGDGGLGDYTALASLARAAARHGANALAISPVHALFSANPSRFSPYAPSSRLFLNTFHIDPAAVPGTIENLVGRIKPRSGGSDDLVGSAGCSAARLSRPTSDLRAAPLVIDWPAAAGERIARLRALFDRMAAHLADPASREPLAQEFREFRAQGGQPLEDHARFEALHAVHRADWRTWPAGLRDARGAAVTQLAREREYEVTFHVFLQWLAHRQLGAAQAAARAAGMKLGLIADLAVGTDGGGSEAWGRPHDLLVGLSVGAPPDELNVHGQNWGLTTYSPRALRAQDCAPFRAMLRAALRHAGGLRIDHVLGLNRLWLIPEGAPPTEGAYLKYPLQDLLGAAARESLAHRAVLVGEDLGTVPGGFREQLASAGLMGLRVLWFTREHGLYVDPSRWPAEVMATTTTHDLPTVAGWWLGRDLDWRERLGLFAANSSAPAERELRAGERRALWDAFVHAGVAQGELPADCAPVIDGAIRFIARTPSKLAIVPIEDLAGLVEQPNLPGTVDQHPNWRRRLPAAAEELLSEPAAAARLASLREERS